MPVNRAVNGETVVRPLNIVIIGAGLGGLSAAIALRRAGHNVKVLEQSRLTCEFGAPINIPPNAHGALLHLGVNPLESAAVQVKWITEYDKTGASTTVTDFAARSSGWQHLWLLAHRVDLHSQLRRAATSPQGQGKAVELLTGSKVVDVDTETAIVTLEDGSQTTCDLVIGADGIRSKTRTKLTSVTPFPSGKSAYRFLVQKSDVLKDPNVSEILKRDGELAIWFGCDRRIVLYPTRNSEVLNFVCIYPDDFSETVGDGWNTAGHQSNLLKVFEGFDPRALTLLKMADPSTLKVWRLMDMDKVERWCKGKLCLLGDAAHPFLPHQGQGGAQAIEDAVTLGDILPLGTEPADVVERLRLYQDIRQERAEKVQTFTRSSGADLTEGSKHNLEKLIELFLFSVAHDEHHNTMQKFREWNYKRHPGLFWRMPISFGPFPGPRQDFTGQCRVTEKSRYINTTLKFKTSRTLLQNLLPSSSFSYSSPDTFAYASVFHQKLDKMAWLGGDGYDLWGLSLHGVRYTKKDGSTLDGSYVPFLFENLTDPILSGREELGYPKIYAEIEINRKADSFALSSTWRDAEFASFKLEGLQSADNDPIPPKDDGIFVYKYIPATAKRGVADVEYAVCDPDRADPPSQRWETKTGSIKFSALDWKSLPTIHHIAQRLEELPIYEFVSGAVEEGEGVPDIAAAYRIE